MKAAVIGKGMTLRLKAEALDRYGMSELEALVRVDELHYKGGYKTPWVRSGKDYYRPSDFKGVA